ncbi:MAG TPA: bifunctional precorrin-2 dehydrogenase/sirohydrochlorin ferrochelatase [Candidatus Methanoperedenaceae archaeon]|nr:bifunctional precorrin-2 dehydrogenase/sirohydrochlorin ferrochelatase [Candidatus Methanoperedenaceae archaeon]
MAKLLPLLLDLEGKTVVIFGGGAVGERKARLFSQYAHTVVVSMEFTEGLDALGKEGRVELVRGRIDDDIIGKLIGTAFIVVPATGDSSLNEQIACAARREGKLLDLVEGIGDVVVPSVIRRGDLTIGISTLGSSPALSKYVRLKIEKVITHEYGDMARLQSDVRELLKKRVGSQELRKKILWDILMDEKVWEELSLSYEKAYNTALEHIPD